MVEIEDLVKDMLLFFVFFVFFESIQYLEAFENRTIAEGDSL